MFCKVSAPLAFNKTVQTRFFLILCILHLNAREFKCIVRSPTKFPDGYVTLLENLKNEWLFLKFHVTNDNITNLNFTSLPTFPRRLRLEKSKTFLLCLHSLIKTLSIKLYKPDTKLKVGIPASNFEFSQAIQTRKTFFIAWVWRWDLLEQQRFIHTDGPWIEVVSLAKLSDQGPWYWGSWLIIKLLSVAFVIVISNGAFSKNSSWEAFHFIFYWIVLRAWNL